MNDIFGKKERKKGGAWVILLLVLLFGSNGFVGWMWWQERGKYKFIFVEKENVQREAENVKHELMELRASYDSIRVANASMQKEIDEKKHEIEKLIAEADKHKNNAYIIAKLKKETQTLREIMQHFVKEIDSLNTLNKFIVADREKVKKELKTEKEKNEQLAKEKEGLQQTVNAATMLKAAGVTAVAIDARRGGKKEVETKKAKRTDKVKIKFSLAENPVAKKGDRTIYLRIITPEGKEMTQAEDTAHIFSFENSRGYWASKKTITYSNEETQVIMYAHTTDGQNFVNGKYIIEINTDGATIGSATLTLD